jgi:hypothetical protein
MKLIILFKKRYKFQRILKDMFCNTSDNLPNNFVNSRSLILIETKQQTGSTHNWFILKTKTLNVVSHRFLTL